MTQYRAIKGINYPPGNRRANPGDVVDDLPAASIKSLLAMGAIEEVEEPRTPATEPAPAALPTAPATDGPDGESSTGSEAHSDAPSDKEGGE